MDENLDWRLSRDSAGHTVDAVPHIGWAGLKNGALLARAEQQYDVLITMDAGIRRQQNISKFNIAVVTLQAPSNRLADTQPLMPKLLALLPTLKPGQLLTVVS